MLPWRDPDYFPQELLYSTLTRESDCQASGLSPEEIEARLDDAGPGGFDPGLWLEITTVPGLWIHGGLDLSVPVDRSVRNLHEIRDRLGRDITTVVVPDGPVRALNGRVSGS